MFLFRKRPLLSVAAAVSALLAAGAEAAVPTSTAVEGLLLSSGGGPAADGNYTVTFGIYSAETGSSPVWTEAGVSVAAKNGQFAYMLGSKTPLSATVVNLSTAWLGMQIGTDAELPRRPLGATLFALRAAVAEGLECSGCIKSTMLDAAVLQAYAKTTDLAPYAKSADLAAYAKVTDLSAYAKASDLAAYAKATDLAAYAKASDLSAYVKAASLAAVAASGSYTDLTNKPNLAKVSTTGAYADLSGAPPAITVGSACGTGLFLKGIATDGSYTCAAIKAADLPPDGLATVSNGLIVNQFTDSQAGTTDVAIKDGLGAGVTDTLTFPDVGIAQKVAIQVTVANSDLSGVRIELYGPSQSTPYVLYDGGKTGTALTALFNDTTAIVSGDINKDWVGKNIKGLWSITVKDLKLGGGTGGIDGKFNWSVQTGTLSAKKIQVKGGVTIDGTTTATGVVTAASDINAAGVVTAGGQPVLSNFKYVIINNDYRNNTSTVANDAWADIPARKLVYNKTRDASVIRIQYSDILGTSGTNYGQCNWRIMVDGNSYAVFSDADITYSGGWRMAHGTHSALAGGLKAGSHTITVQTYRQAAASECLMGWNTNGNFLSAEEVGP